MKAAVKVAALSLLTLIVALLLRRAFFWNVRPISWDHRPPQNGALEMAFMLLSIQNVATIVAAIAIAIALALWINRWRNPKMANVKADA